MTDQQWQCAWEIYQAASELPDEERRSYLASISADPEVFEQVISLLEEPAQGSTGLSVQPGTRIGRYEVVGTLGRGGMGQVYSALDTELERYVALKFLAPETIAIRPAVDRLIREAKAASALNHPHIVTVYEVLRSAGEVALAMELVEGESLRSYCGKPQPLAQVIRWGRQAAQAIAAAHGRNIVHRDIKPENLMVRSDGYIKVLDFGIARQVAQAGESHVSLASAESTKLAGTLKYMAPEQTRGRTASTSSDVFSLGIVLYELVTGTHPFQSDSPIDTAHAIAHSDPKPPRELNRTIPKALNSLLLAMLAKHPDERPSALDVDRMLSDIELADGADSPDRIWSSFFPDRGTARVEHHPARVKIGPLKAGLRFSLTASGVAAGLVLALVFWIVGKQIHREPVMTQLTTQSSENRVSAAALSPDGRYLAFGELGGPIELRRMSDGSTHPLSTPVGLSVDRIAWFADGSRLLVSGVPIYGHAGIWVIPILAGSVQRVKDQSKDGVPSPDGTRIAYTNLDRSEIWVTRVGGAATCLVRAENTTFSSLIWSPDSKRVEYQRQDVALTIPRPSGLGSDQSGGGEPLPSAPAHIEENYGFSYESREVATGRLIASVRNLAMSSACGLPDGRVLFLSWISASRKYERQLWELRANPSTGQLLGPARKLSYTTGLDLDSISASQDGKQVVVVLTTERPNVYVADLSVGNAIPHLLKLRRLTDDDADQYPHGWTGDGTTVIYESNRTGRFQLYRQKIGDPQPQSLVVAPGNTVLASVSSDRKWILYRWDDRGLHQTLMRVAMGGGAPEPLGIDLHDDGFRCALKPSGGCVLRSVEDGRFVFSELDPVRGKGRELARTAWDPPVTGDWDLSPDGTQVAIPNHTSVDAKVRIIALRGTRPPSEERTVTLSGLTSLNAVVWSADGNGWFVTIRAPLQGELFYANLDGQLWELSPSISTYVVPSPDGRHVAFPNSLGLSNAWSFSWKSALAGRRR